MNKVVMNAAICEGLRPAREAFTAAEWLLIQRLDTPVKVQKHFSSLPYNREANGPSLRSFRELVKVRGAPCPEAAVPAAWILEQHGFPPLWLARDPHDWLD